jgi:hypothetical protein
MLPEIPANFDDNVVRNEWRELAAKVVKSGGPRKLVKPISDETAVF